VSNTVKVFKFVTSEEVIAEVVNQSLLGNGDFRYTIKNCIQIVLQAGQQGFGSIMIPWGSVESDIVVDERSLLFRPGEPNRKLLDNYNKAFSKLDLPPEKSLLIG
jgi:hypothetical protein